MYFPYQQQYINYKQTDRNKEVTSIVSTPAAHQPPTSTLTTNHHTQPVNPSSSNQETVNSRSIAPVALGWGIGILHIPAHPPPRKTKTSLEPLRPSLPLLPQDLSSHYIPTSLSPATTLSALSVIHATWKRPTVLSHRHRLTFWRLDFEQRPPFEK
jgi:hypothetical protein